MRDLAAAVVAMALLLLAVSLGTTLTWYRRRRQRALDAERRLGRTVLAELPTSEGLVLFTEDQSRFYYGDRSVDKGGIVAVRVLINGSPIAALVSDRTADEVSTPPPASFADRPEGIARDRWDVAIETAFGATVIECGAVRERVSQELARTVFEAVKRSMQGPYHSTSGAPAR